MTIKERAIFIVNEIKDICEITFDREDSVISAVVCALAEIEIKKGNETEKCRK